VINAPVQGTAADIIKIAMIKTDEWIIEKETRLILQVHDELVYEVKNNKVKDVAENLKNIMESVIDIKKSKGVPLVVDVLVGDTWGSLKGLERAD